MLNFLLSDCNYTCHWKCSSLVTLNCKTADSTLNSYHELAVASCSNLKMFTENDEILEVCIFFSSSDFQKF